MVLEIVNKMVDLLKSDIDTTTRTSVAQVLLPTILRLNHSEELKLTLPEHQSNKGDIGKIQAEPMDSLCSSYC